MGLALSMIRHMLSRRSFYCGLLAGSSSRIMIGTTTKVTGMVAILGNLLGED